MHPTTPPVAAPAPPKRRKRWKLLGGAALVLLLAPVAYYFVAGWFAERSLQELYSELDADDPNWRWHDLVAELQPPADDENAATQILKVEAMLQKGNPLGRGGKWEQAPLQHRNARLSDVYIDPLRAAFATLPKDAVAEARKLKTMPRGRLPIEQGVENPFEMDLEYVQRTRNVMNLLQYDALLRGQDGDFEGAAETCEALIHTAGALNEHPLLISQLVRIAGQQMATSATERLLAQGKLSEASLARLQAALEREAEANVLYFGMRGERAAGHQYFMSVRDGTASLSRLMNGPKGKVSLEDRLLDMFPGVILHGHPDYLRLMHENVQASKLPFPERAEAFGKLEAKVRQSKTMAVRLLMPAVMKVADAAQRSQAYLRSAITAIAAERYRLKTQAWPAGTKDLVSAGLLKAIPTDPYDGQPLRWRLTPTGGAIAYSIGRDKIDDGGNLARTLPWTTNGIDFGFELWPPSARGLPAPAEEEKTDK